MSPSTIEKIRAIQQSQLEAEKKQAAAEARKQAEKAALEAQHQRQAEESRRLAAEKARIQLQMAQDTLKQSRVVEELKQIETQLLIHIPRHNLFVSPDGTKATLVWGNRYSISTQGEVVYEKTGFFIFADGVLDCSIISASADHSGTIEINGTKIPKDEWSGNPEKISDILSRSFISPVRQIESENEVRSRRYSSSGSSNSECCNN